MKSSVSISLVRKLSLSFLMIILLAGAGYVLITSYFYRKYFEETTQILNGHVANHLIDEKFTNESPFLEDGSVNKPLFGDIMHDMMSVNQGIEVYLLDAKGVVLYSVVLDHDSPDAKMYEIDMGPVQDFISSNGQKYVLGDDPRNPQQKKIFSAAPFEKNGKKGYIYIILAGKLFDEAMSLLGIGYFLRIGMGATVITILISALIGVFVIFYLTRQLREIIFITKRFKEGDYEARISNPEKADLAELALTFNEMADATVANMEKQLSLEKLRQELIANVSHDLRTPLAIMNGYVETLQIKKNLLSEEEKNKYLAIIKNSSEKLSHLVAQLFEYSKLEASQIEPHKEPFNISELAHDVYSNYQVLAEKKDITLALNVEKRVPLVFADISLVERVIQNLMDNALKFTPENGQVTIKIDSNDKEVSISVSDTGPGIPERDQVYIFERYQQVKAKAQKSTTGAGLGLAIAKKIMEIHDSTIRVVSKPNMGTTFQFNLPVCNVG